MAWQRFRVGLVDHDGPLEVQTNGLDWANVVIDPGAPKAMDMTFRVVHAALLRTAVDGVPRDYRVFVAGQVSGGLDGIPETLDGDEGDAAADPTNATP